MTDEVLQWSRDVEAVDYLMYRGEIDARSRTSMMSVEILDPAPDWNRFCETLERASRAVPRLRQRIVAPVVPIAQPQWVTDPDFSLSYHVRRIRAPEPGTLRQVLDLAQSFYATPLDMSRPLWEAILVEGVTADGGEAALLWKMSHSVTDGVGGMELDRRVRSFDPDAPRGPMPPVPVPEDLSAMELTRSAARRLPLTVVTGGGQRAATAIRAGAGALRRPAGAARDVARFTQSLGRIIGPAPVPPSPLLRRRSLNRRFEVHTVALDDLRRAGRAHGCSVNDAYIAALCGALRRYHEALGVPVDTLSIALPVSLRSTEDPGGGNQWAGVRIPGPVGEPDPGRRMSLIREQVITARDEPAINALGIISPVLARLPMALVMAFGGGGAATDLQASNVPGHTQPTYIGGAKVLRTYPFGPLPGGAMMVVMVSHVGCCYIGVNYDTAAVTDPDLFATSLREGFDEVIASASDSTGTNP